VSDPIDWKQKYRDSLGEMEAGEKSWRQVEQALRRLVGRLCAAGMGVNPDLDTELQSLAAANRRNAPADELEILAGSLTSTIVAVDAVAPIGVPAASVPAASVPAASVPAAPMPAASVRWNSTCAAVLAVLQSLKDSGAEEPPVEPLMAQLSVAGTDAALAGIVTQIADLISSHCEATARERLKSASVLFEVTARLGEMTLYLTESGLASRASFDDTANLDSGVMSHVRELSAEVNAATELAALQSLVSARLESVTQQMSDFREREEARRKDQESRTAHMHERIADLEREAEELYRKLDHEKHGARQDALTRLANRKCFDERMARQIGGQRRDDAPAVMLIWDIDDFKSINDRYGHRAGDRVLQTVANCFVSGLRTEDFVARIGGEEFVVLTTGATAAAALRIANELRGAVEALRFHFRGTPVRVTVSCGITELRPGDTPASAFDRADSALYRAKREGKNLCIAA
jgi:diguanylate cyclase